MCYITNVKCSSKINSLIISVQFILIKIQALHGYAIHCSYKTHWACVNNVPILGIALGYGLDDRGSRIRFPAGAGNFSLHHRVQNGSGAHPASYPMGTRDSLL
jgi:hypothetical protein